MRLFLAFAVTLSFLAGQACGNGVRMFHPLEDQDHGNMMSRVMMQCDAGMHEHMAGESTGCGPGKCMENAKDEPDDVAEATARIEVPAIPVTQHIIHASSVDRVFIAYVQRELKHERSVFIVRRE